MSQIGGRSVSIHRLKLLPHSFLYFLLDSKLLFDALFDHLDGQFLYLLLGEHFFMDTGFHELFKINVTTSICIGESYHLTDFLARDIFKQTEAVMHLLGCDLS